MAKIMKSPTLKSHDALLLIADARDAEMCRDLDLLGGLLLQVWEDFDLDPDYSALNEEVEAELLRLSGVYVSEKGRSRGSIDQQIRAKNILTQAVEKFASVGNREKSAEAKIALAVCYWYSGEVEECNAILHTIETEFDKGQSIYLQIQVNRIGCLNWQGKHDQALRIIGSLDVYSESCADKRLKAQFYNHAGITCHFIKENEKAINYLLKAVRTSTLIKNDRFLGLNLNCLAVIYREVQDFESAHLYATEAISVFGSIGDTGWIPHVLDSRALIFLDEERPEEALDTIDKAISLFSESEDYSGLTEAMFTKCRCLLRLRRGPEAFALFAELGHIASVRIGETALHKYAKLLTEEVRYVTGKTLRERTDFLKKDLIREALHASGGNIGDAAKALGETHQALSFMLKSKYPDLYDEFGIKRKPRKTQPPAKKPEPPIQHVLMPPGIKFAYDFPVDEDLDFSTYLLSAELTRRLGLRGSKLIAVAKIADFEPDMLVLYETKGVFDIDRLTYDSLTNLFLIDRGEGDFVFLTEEVKVLGNPIGYCDLEDVDQSFLKFRKISHIP